MELQESNTNLTLENEPKEDDPLHENGKRTQKKKPVGEWIINVFKNITVEPSVFFYIVPMVITGLPSQNLALEKACRVNLQYSTDICDSLMNQTLESQNQYEREVQKVLSSALTVKTYMTAAIPCLLTLFIGCYSDQTGYRKVFITLPMFGQILGCINGVINVYFFSVTNLQTFLYVGAVLDGITGGMCVFGTIIFAFIASITTAENRTFRVGIVNFCLSVGFPVGLSLSGILLRSIGYYGCYGMSAGLQMLNLLYTLVVLKDPPRNEEQKKHDGKGVCHFFRTFFDFTNIKNTVQVVMKKTPDNRRLRLCILLLVVTILFGPMYGEISIMYMSTRYRFNWDEVKFSLFQTYNFITHTIGTIFSITVFSKYLKWHDSILGIISTLSKIAASFVYCFAPNERIFFIAPLVEILNGTALLAMRSIVSKLVEPDELGKINSLFGLTENLMPLLYVPLYTQVYTATMETLPGFVFLMGALMTIPAVAVFFWLFYEHRKYVRKSKVPKTPVD
ncbi:lysosomal proton-coupled steroid conjugate and bile acid symporter SLC46A3 isoform X2 [Amyelois transitella]|uniref:lysosomal proton-coupled steroid conjugate and bile acid symporter SLC46A3 isoform X2 n=1 Tax=Amyelois transitella TaxID=680683 RepID=UPI00067BB1EA|nr:lysosomal proton-coupled steroid conjugate and bile acid symporter SLC46A3 isoform X2 [Amyelois transitella]